MAKNRLNIAVIPGDGIGKEVIPEGLRVIAGRDGTVRYQSEFRSF